MDLPIKNSDFPVRYVSLPGRVNPWSWYVLNLRPGMCSETYDQPSLGRPFYERANKNLPRRTWSG